MRGQSQAWLLSVVTAGGLFLSACGAPVSAPPLGRFRPALAADDFRADGVSKREVVVLHQPGRRFEAPGMRTKWSIASLGAAVLELPSGRTPEGVVATLARTPGVRYADLVRQVDFEYGPYQAVRGPVELGFEVEPAPRPKDDPRMAEQYGLELTRAREAWSITRGNRQTLLAIVDSGIDLTHPDLQDQVVSAYNVVTRGSDVSDTRGHGTHTSGIAAAAAGNGEGGAGVAPGCGLLAVQIASQGPTKPPSASDVLAAEGVVWAVDKGAKVVSMSFGFYRRSRVLEEALQYALDRDVVLVASAGNKKVRNDPEQSPHLPSTYPGVIEVTALDRHSRPAVFSNFGRTVTVAAPGVDVLSSIPGGYQVKSGTSMAAPHVAGVAALVRSHYPDLDRDTVKRRIEASAVDLGDPGFDEVFGHGLVDAAAALGEVRVLPARR